MKFCIANSLGTQKSAIMCGIVPKSLDAMPCSNSSKDSYKERDFGTWNTLQQQKALLQDMTYLCCQTLLHPLKKLKQQWGRGEGRTGAEVVGVVVRSSNGTCQIACFASLPTFFVSLDLLQLQSRCRSKG